MPVQIPANSFLLYFSHGAILCFCQKPQCSHTCKVWINISGFTSIHIDFAFRALILKDPLFFSGQDGFQPFLPDRYFFSQVLIISKHKHNAHSYAKYNKSHHVLSMFHFSFALALFMLMHLYPPGFF